MTIKPVYWTSLHGEHKHKPAKDSDAEDAYRRGLEEGRNQSTKRPSF